jgi:3-oxoacyl-[acyl-carrier-protein] synthase II
LYDDDGVVVLASDAMRRAWVTGIGCVTPIGTGVEAFTESLRKGRPGIGPLTLIDPRPYACRVAAEVRDFVPEDHMPLREARSSPRVVQFAVAAARMARQHAGISRWRDPSRVAILLGSSIGSLTYSGAQLAIFLERGIRKVHPSFPAFGHSGVIASECAIQLGIRGQVLTISSACTSSADAIGWGRDLIAGGIADVVLCGGAEAPLSPIVFASFDRLGMMPSSFNDSPEAACRPFAADREGMVMGEGAAVLILESDDHVRERGGRPLAEVAGHGATCDADSHFTQKQDGEDAMLAIRLALERAGVAAEQIDYVNAHGTATPQNDPFETRVLRAVLGPAHRPFVSSTKSMVGHLLGACSAIEAAATVVAIQGAFVPPTLNLHHPDPECDLDYVPNEARSHSVEVALSTSFGFGSRNAALVLRRGDDGR